MIENYSSIKRKILNIVLVTSGAVLLFSCTVFFTYEFFSYRQTARDQLFTLGQIVAANSTAALVFKSQVDADEILQALKAEKHIIAAGLYDENGNLFSKYPLDTLTRVPKHPKADEYDYIKSNLEGFQAVVQQDKRVGTLYLRFDMKAVYERFKLYALVTLLVVIIAIWMAYLLSSRLQRRVSGPILELAKTAKIVSNEKNYGKRARKFYNDEVGELTDAFNQMLVDIERQNAAILTFNHELESKVKDRTNDLAFANTALKLKNEFVEKIIDSSVDLIAVFDKNLNYVILNEYAQQAYNVAAKDIIGRNIIDVFPLLRDSQMYHDLNKSLMGKRVHNARYRSLVSDKILENYYIPLADKDGEIYNVLVIGHDITDTVSANEKLEALNDELKKSNRDLEQFAYVASHDLQEPLRKIQTYASLLEEKSDDKAVLMNYLAKIVSSAERMKTLITSLLFYSQISNIKGNFEEIDLNETINNIILDYEVIFTEKKAHIAVDKLPFIVGDKLQLSQLFLNLISNSLKYSQNNPEIIILSSVTDKNDLPEGILKSNGNYLKLSFRDNGIGFDQKFAGKIFTIFQRLHNRQTYPGTGIGLALCKKIVDNHRGNISVDSVQGEGTTFTIYLPLVYSEDVEHLSFAC